MEIEVRIKQVYGKDVIYPICDKAKLLCKLAGHITLTERDIKTIKELGYGVKVVQEIVSL